MTSWLIVLVCYNDNPNYNDYSSKIKDLFKLCLIKDIIIVNTSLGEIISTSNDGYSVVAHKNMNVEMEFSGYYYGLEWYNKQNSISEKDNQSFIILNDTIFKHGKLRKIEKIAFTEWGILNRFRNFTKPTIFGFWHTSKFLQSTEMKDGYFNSKFLAFKNVSFENFTNLMNLNNIKVRILSDNTYENNIFISDEYGLFLKKWLNEEGGWYKAAKINESNKSLFESKAKSIIHEHYLSLHSKKLSINSFCMIKNSLIVKMIMFLTGFKY